MKRIFAVLAMLVCVIGGITGILLLGNDEGDDVSTKKVQDAAGGDHGITEISSKESVNTEKSERVMIYKIGCSFYVLKELILKFKERKRG